jgi:mRNA-degrading endonuclease toxin of MazEF toxin-antitoxin module
LIVLDQLQSVDKDQLAKKAGTVSPKTLGITLKTLLEIFAE